MKYIIHIFIHGIIIIILKKKIWKNWKNCSFFKSEIINVISIINLFNLKAEEVQILFLESIVIKQDQFYDIYKNIQFIK